MMLKKFRKSTSKKKKSAIKQDADHVAVSGNKAKFSGFPKLMKFGLVITMGLVGFYWINNQDDEFEGEPVAYVKFKALTKKELETLKANNNFANFLDDEQIMPEPMGDINAHSGDNEEGLILRLQDQEEVEVYVDELADAKQDIAIKDDGNTDEQNIKEKVQEENDNILSFEFDNGSYVPAPANGLYEETSYGKLPIISSKGKKSYQVYASMNNEVAIKSAKPMIAIVIGGIGISKKGTLWAINNLNPNFTLAFAPYGKNLQNWVARARSAGHEVMLQVPMEPYDYPNNDPGPHTLITDAPEIENVAKLNWALGRISGYTGIMNYMGSKYTRSNAAVTVLMKQLKKRGLLYFDDGSVNNNIAPAIASKMNIPNSKANKVIDAISSKTYLDRSLRQLEDLAKRQGHAVGVGNAYPLTMKTIIDWSEGLETKGFTLVPLSAVIARKQIIKVGNR